MNLPPNILIFLEECFREWGDWIKGPPLFFFLLSYVWFFYSGIVSLLLMRAMPSG